MKSYYTTKEAAEELGVTAAHVRRMVLDSLIQAEKFGRDLMISAAEIERARQRKTTRGPEPTAKAEAIAPQPTKAASAKKLGAKPSAGGGAKAAKKKGGAR